MARLPITLTEALTFDDVLLRPGHSRVMPSTVDITTRLTREITLNLPIVSAAMDTVTEARLAIAMAQAGGIGVIHQNLTPSDQAAEVRKVKRYESGMVVDPITIFPDATLADALYLMAQNGISGIPVVERGATSGKGKLVGILTNRDVRFAQDKRQPIAELMTKNLVTVREGVGQGEAQRLLHEHRIEKLLVVDADYHCVGLVTVKDIEKATQHPNACKDPEGRLRVAAASTVGDYGYERALQLIDAGADCIVIDTAHGHSQAVIDQVARVKRENNKVQIIAGNIATAEAAKALIDAGAEVVMMGSLFAGTEESPGEVFLYQGRSFKSYRGMGSVGAMVAGSATRYFQGDVKDQLKLVPEGIEGQVPYRGPIAPILYQLAGGLRSAMGYVGAPTIREFQERAQFVRITNAGLRESHVHDVSITRESPNYPTGV